MLQSYKFNLNASLIKLIYWRVFDAALGPVNQMVY
jgi:hypothetical protein